MRKNSFTADFETTTEIDDCRVWAWGIASITSCETEMIGKDIASFINYINNQNIDIYFHNLKFDGEFIVSYLLNIGMEHSRERKAMTFETLIADNGQWYGIIIYWSIHKKRQVKTCIYDSLKKLPFTVEKIAKDFHLPIQKGSIDYKKHRPIVYEMTENEIDYLKNDIEIMAIALSKQFGASSKKMTIGSDALSNFKKSLDGSKKSKQVFESYFPKLDLDTDADIRRAYKGGFSYLNPKFKGVHLQGNVYDVNSLYPSIMRNKVLPYGEPVFFIGEYEEVTMYPLYIQRITCSFELRENHIPMVQLRNHSQFIQTEYLSSSKDEIIELVLCSVDLELFLKHYKTYNLEYQDGYMFKGSNTFFVDYIDYWGHIKETTTGAERQIAKLMLNSLYGKFASSTKRRNKTPYLKGDGVLGFIDDQETRIKPVYTALALFVTAYGRNITIGGAQSNYDRFIYCDTDSLHLVGYEHPDNIKLHKTHLGFWDFETQFTDSKFLRAKTYMQYYDNEWHITCAGMPSKLHDQVTWDNFKVGTRYTGKLTHTHAKGGIVLLDADFVIREPTTSS